MNDILTMLTGVTVNDPKAVIEQGYIGNDTSTANCLIKTFEVHSICKGVILAADIDPNNNHWAITVEVDSQHWVRYCNLASHKVKVGQSITFNDLIGFGFKCEMRLEYCTSEVSQFPVRLLSRQLYKHDPAPIIFGQGLITGVL